MLWSEKCNPQLPELQLFWQRSGVVVKAVCLGSRRSRVRTPLWHLYFKETKCFFLAHSHRFNIVGSLRDREVACSKFVISLISASSIQNYTQTWSKSPFISFLQLYNLTLISLSLYPRAARLLKSQQSNVFSHRDSALTFPELNRLQDSLYHD